MSIFSFFIILSLFHLKMVKCPICSIDVPLRKINSHLDDCEIELKREQRKKETPEPTSIDDSNHDASVTDTSIEVDSQPKKSLTALLTGNRKPKDRPRSYRWEPPAAKQQLQPQHQEERSNDRKHELDTVDNNVNLPNSSPVKKSKPNPIDQLKLTYHLPLSERLRPKDIATYIGQKHLVGPNGILRGSLAHGRVPSLILWGHPGTGKTTLARILGKASNSRVVEMSGVMHGVSDCKKVFEEAQNEMKLTRKPTIVFVDEIHRFNKNQQDIFLGYVERGIIILIGATTENPSFNINKALLSRCKVFVLEKLQDDEMKELLTRGFVEINKVRRLIHHQPFLKIDSVAIDWIVGVADGDGRLALGCVELIDSNFINSETDDQSINVSLSEVKSILKKSTVLYDRVGDAHYDTISAFHKSIRGSNPDAAMYYLARMLKGGEDPLYIARRMIRIASEDIGILDDSCLPFAIAAYQAVQFVGLPEADLALVHCAVKLSRAPKSVEIYKGWKEMKTWMEEPGVEGAEIPLHLRNAPTKLMNDLGYSKGYKYNPDFKDGNVKQTYFPKAIGETIILKGKHLGDSIDPDL